MQKNLFFSKRIKILRLAHNLSFAQIAVLLDKKKTVFAEMESGKTTTTLDGLVDISALFGVSIDWLCGVSDEPYKEDIITSLEQELYSFAKPSNINLSKNTEYLYFYYVVNKILDGDTYFSGSKVKDSSRKYSLPQRANVIFCLNVFKYFSLHLHNEGFDVNEVPFREAMDAWIKMQSGGSVLDSLKNIFSTKRARTTFGSLILECYDCLQEIHFQGPSLKKIFFDITKVDLSSSDDE